MKATALAPRAEALAAPSISQLAADWRTARAQAEVEDKRFDLRQAEAEKLYSPRPAGGLYSPFLFARDEAAAEFWWAQVKAIDASFDLPRLESISNQAWSTVEAIASRVLALRPTSAEEAALKYEIMLTTVRDHEGKIDDPAPVFAFLADLEHLAKLNGPV